MAMSAKPARKLEAVELVEAPASTAWDTRRSAWVRKLKAKNLSPRTLVAYTASLDRLAAWCLTAPAPPLDDPLDVTSDDLDEWLDYALNRTTRHGRKASAAAVAKDYRHVRVFFRWLASKEGVAPITDACEEPKTDEVPVPILSDDELGRLVEACRGRSFAQRRDLAIIRLLLDCGMRRAELTGIELDDLDLDAQVVTISRETAKGRVGRAAFYGAKTAEALDDYLASRAKHPDRRLSALWLAVAPHSGALGYDGIPAILERRASEAGVDGVFAHRFRHTAAHAYLMAGGSEGDAMRLFGWKTRTMVDRYGASAGMARAIASARKLSPGDRI